VEWSLRTNERVNVEEFSGGSDRHTRIAPAGSMASGWEIQGHRQRQAAMGPADQTPETNTLPTGNVECLREKCNAQQGKGAHQITKKRSMGRANKKAKSGGRKTKTRRAA